MHWLKANFLDSDIKSKIIERSGGYCECRLREHHHPNGRCGNHLGLKHFFFSQQNSANAKSADLVVLCPTCYRAIVTNHINKS